MDKNSRIASNSILEEHESKKSRVTRFVVKLLLIFEICLVVVFSIVAIYTPFTTTSEIDNFISSEHLIGENCTIEETQSTHSHLQLLNSSVFSSVETYNNGAVIYKECAMHCPEAFIDTYYSYFLENDVHSNHKYIGNTQTFSTEPWYGEYFLSENKNEICYILRDEHSFISVRMLKLENVVETVESSRKSGDG